MAADHEPEGPLTTLAWPDHDTGPTPPPESAAARRDEPATRKKLPFWDRVKFLLLFGIVWLVLVWNAMASNPTLPFDDAAREQFRSGGWVLLLGCLELVRQGHYLIAENLSWYHRVWSEKVFGGFERRTGRLNDWNRYRLARALKFLFLVAVLAMVLGRALHEPAPVALFKLPGLIYKSLPLLLQIVFAIVFVVIQFVALFYFLSKGGVDVYFPEDIKTRFSDVWGQDKVVERVKENILYLENPESIEAKGGYVPGGILLWGPPGTGKTLMAEAVAGETGKPYVFVDPGAFINMFMGVGILKVKSLFRKLRKLAVRYGGVIVFFDEADSLGSRGAMTPGAFGGAGRVGGVAGKATAPTPHTPGCNGRTYLTPDSQSLLLQADRERNGFVMGMGGGGSGTLQALLTELSGLKKPRGFVNRVVRKALGLRPKPPPKYRILVMMATNMPDALDEAMLRPGRIDRIYRVGYPSKEGRKRTFEGYLAKVSHRLTDAEVDKIATISRYATGATIKDMVNEALINAIRDGRDCIEWRDIMEAKRLKELGLPEGMEYSDRERHATAVHEACHAVVAYRARHNMTIDLATIEGRGNILGMVSSVRPEDEFSTWRSEYEADIMVSLASLAGEKMFFEGDSTNGVFGDLSSATHMAIHMEGYVGMGSTIASHHVTRQEGVGGGGPGGAGGKKEAELLAGTLGARIEKLLRELLERTESLVAQNRLEVLAVAHALETHKTLDGDDVIAVIEGRPGPLVDGRVYKDPEFARLAEAYHAKAVEAHQSHQRTMAPLPIVSVNGNGNGGGNGHGPVGELDEFTWEADEALLELAATPKPSPPRRPRRPRRPAVED